LDYGKSISQYSNKSKYIGVIESESMLREKIKDLRDKYKKIVVFPTDDHQLEMLASIYSDIIDFCYIPCNSRALLFESDKSNQYRLCEKSDIPYPKSKVICNKFDIGSLESLEFPLIIKPITRVDRIQGDIFRNLYVNNLEELEDKVGLIEFIVNLGVELLVSEFIPGDDTNIYAYTCFKGDDGVIYSEWVGKKLTQYPDDYGVVASASNQAPEAVLELGRRLCESMDSHGILEPEFKYDARDNSFKLMEVNLRSMMWNHVGYCSGVNLHSDLYDYANKIEIKPSKQNTKDVIHWVLMLHEIPNLLNRKGYWKHFKHNVFKGEKRHFAIFSFSDPLPFFASCIILTKNLISQCLKR
ncbi:TPA: hypothetical protein ACVO18_004742, partial [Vibrio alginolyticus]